MSVIHSINIEINAEYTLINIEKLLHTGHLSNIIYFSGENLGTPVISYNQAAQKIFIMNQNALDQEDSPYIFSRFEDTYFCLWITKKNNDIEVSMGAFMYPWYKKFRNSGDTHFDFNGYINLLLKTCSDFPIQHLVTETMY